MQDWYHCSALFQNGWVLATHLCSSPGFAFHDLWGRRPERQAAVKEMGIEVETDPSFLINDNDLEIQWPWLLEAYNECDMIYWNREYMAAENRLGHKEDSRSPSITLEFTDDNMQPSTGDAK